MKFISEKSRKTQPPETKKLLYFNELLLEADNKGKDRH